MKPYIIIFCYVFYAIDDPQSETEESSGYSALSTGDVDQQQVMVMGGNAVINIVEQSTGDDETNSKLSGADRTINPIDYWSQQSKLVVQRSTISVTSIVQSTKHYLLTNNGYKTGIVEEAGNLVYTQQQVIINNVHILPDSIDENGIDRAKDMPVFTSLFLMALSLPKVMERSLIYQFPESLEVSIDYGHHLYNTI